MSTYSNYWHEEMSEAVARDILGSSHFDWSVQQGPAFCRGRAMGQWQANQPEGYGAYLTAERVAQAS